MAEGGKLGPHGRRKAQLTYLDQNALIELGVKARNPDFRKKLDHAIDSGSFKSVVSSWHLIETANTKNVANATELGIFLDSLKPAWLLERRDIQRLDVQEDFYRFVKVDFKTISRITNRSAVIAALNNAKDSPRFDIASDAFVKQWIAHPEQLEVLKRAYADNAKALTGIREARKAGKLTEEVKRQADQLLVKGSMPTSTPNGVAVGPEVARDYLSQVDVGLIPSLAIETAISEHEWARDGGADSNTLIDKFHLISALPYVDEVVSKDKFFEEIFPIAQATGYVRARLVKNDNLCARF